MPTAPAKVKQADIVRALKAAEKAGGNREVLILPDGTIKIVAAAEPAKPPRLDVRKEIRL